MADELVESGVTAFAPPPSPSYRYVISSKAGQISISLEDQKSRQQWGTGYLTEDAYLTNTNRICNAAATDYVSIFKEALDYLADTGKMTNLNTAKTRRKLTAVDDGLQLEMSVKVKVRQRVCAAKFVFDLAPVSLERIDVLEARLRDVEDVLVAAKARVEELEKANVVFLEATSNEQDAEGKLLWDPEQVADGFKVTDHRAALRFLVAGCYILNLNVKLAPRMGVQVSSYEKMASTSSPVLCRSTTDTKPARQLDSAVTLAKTTS